MENLLIEELRIKIDQEQDTDMLFAALRKKQECLWKSSQKEISTDAADTEAMCPRRIGNMLPLLLHPGRS